MIISAITRVAMAACLTMFAGAATAQITSRDRYASMVVDSRTGQVLSAANADETRHPASLTKMMTLYMLFEAMRDGRLTLATPIRVSAEAASRPPSKLGVPAGGSVSAESAILALVTRSANDIATAVGEALAGDEDAFARVMTQRARSLGMTRTTFRNASGLPDPEQVTTARDMVLLGRRLIADFPDQYRYFNTQFFAHGNRMIRNHNGMLRDYPGTDGIKTGFINASGFNIVTSAQRDGVRLVGAVFGGSSWPQRNNHMAELLDEGFQRMGVRAAPAMAAAPSARVAMGRDPAPGPGPRRLVSTAQASTLSRHQARATTRAVAVAAPPARAPARPPATRSAQQRPDPASQARPAAASQARAATPARNTRSPARSAETPATPRQQLARTGG
jgi:D-alanyl-D-alanine carboxypeptidase